MQKQRLPRASAFYARQQWSRKRKRWLYVYKIYPPEDRPFLPSDEALKTVVGRLPEIGFMESGRFPDRDVFFVFGLKRSVFSSRAERVSRRLRRYFLCEVGASATAERNVRAATLELTKRFVEENAIRRIEWNGRHLIVNTKDNRRMESHLRGRCLPPFKELYLACKPELPFYYEAAL